MNALAGKCLLAARAFLIEPGAPVSLYEGPNATRSTRIGARAGSVIVRDRPVVGYIPMGGGTFRYRNGLLHCRPFLSHRYRKGYCEPGVHLPKCVRRVWSFLL